MENNKIINIEGTDIYLKRCENKSDKALEYQIRIKVFMEEQGFTEESEFDPEENNSVGYLIYKDNIAIGVFNYIFRSTNEVFFRRLCFLKEYRRSGYGKHVFRTMENYLLDKVSPLTITFNGEAYLHDYWLKLGYEIICETSEGPTCPPLLLCKKELKKSSD